jgi:hypothetical protein
VEAGSGAVEGDGAATGANGRSLLVRVPFAERVRVVDVCAAGAAGDVGFDALAFVARAGLVGGLAGVLAGVLAEGDFFAPAAVALPWDEPRFVAADRGVAALFGVGAIFGADGEDVLVGFSALMEQRYAVFSARRESDPGHRPPPAGFGSAGPGDGFRCPARTRAVHFPALWASWAGPSRSSWSSR